MICLLPKKFHNISNLLSRFQSVILTQNCGYVNDIIQMNHGPAAILTNKIARGELMKDEHQMEVAKTLENIYNEINGYKPEEFSLLDKWLGRKRKQPPKGCISMEQ